jgi:hypothetical protein
MRLALVVLASVASIQWESFVPDTGLMTVGIEAAVADRPPHIAKSVRPFVGIRHNDTVRDPPDPVLDAVRRHVPVGRQSMCRPQDWIACPSGARVTVSFKRRSLNDREASISAVWQVPDHEATVCVTMYARSDAAWVKRAPGRCFERSAGWTEAP